MILFSLSVCPVVIGLVYAAFKILKQLAIFAKTTVDLNFESIKMSLIFKISMYHILVLRIAIVDID